MCWNAEVSLQTFLVGIVGIGVALNYGLSIPLAFFCVSVSLMQLIEYFVWSNYGNKTVNYWASVAASALLWIQPIASIFTLSDARLRNGLLGAYGLLSLLGKTIEGKKDFSMTRAPNGHLSWNWMTQDNNLFAFLAVYMFFLFTPIIINKNYKLLAIALGTLGLSMFSYWKENTWGSMWCWIVNGIVLLAIGEAIVKGA